jgi:hypothetical protein
MKAEEIKKILNHRDAKLLCDIRTASFSEGVIQMELVSVKKEENGEYVFTFRPLNAQQIAVQKFKH